MNIETLRVFCDVVQHQSFSRGAKINGVSQSAATQSVHRVEEHFGVQLVDRSKRPFVLTPEGQACSEGFREVLELYDSAEAQVRSLRREIGGLVRVAAIYSVGLHDMSRCMQDFDLAAIPRPRCGWSICLNKVYEAVVNGEVDLGILSFPAASPEVAVIPLRSERMAVVCPPGHPLASHQAITAEHLQGTDFIGFDRDLSIRKDIDRYMRQRSISIHVTMEFDNIETIKQAVEIGAGVSILPEPTIRDAVRSGAWPWSAWSRRSFTGRWGSSTASAGYLRPRPRSSSSCCKSCKARRRRNTDGRNGRPGPLPPFGPGSLRAARQRAGGGGGLCGYRAGRRPAAVKGFAASAASASAPVTPAPPSARRRASRPADLKVRPGRAAAGSDRLSDEQFRVSPAGGWRARPPSSARWMSRFPATARQETFVSTARVVCRRAAPNPSRCRGAARPAARADRAETIC